VSYVEPSTLDIQYLRNQCKANGLPEPDEIQEESFIMLCGRNFSDGMTNDEARSEAWKVYAISSD
jgi:hypothetical protein